MPNPAKARHTIGKRLIRVQKQALAEGWHILTFEGAQKELPGTQTRKYRAWWIDLEDIDITAFKKEFEVKKEEPKNE
jgi:hypothetical protein